ncbi:MAG: hypothetical protein BMS9Abin22_078 [Gammaproteobacteria bacterium]|nr:MAG: hypothetical protein BMS9Abin22_078 [Gammaproteobacteria bacterium]
MASEQRIEDLKTYCKQWQESIQHMAKRRDQLIAWQKEGTVIIENDNENILPTLITEADDAVKLYQRIHKKMESLRDRAINGEDV